MGTSVKLVLPSLQQPGFEGDDDDDDDDDHDHDDDYNDGPRAGSGADGDGTWYYIDISPLDPKTMKNEGFKPPIYGL